MAYTPVGLRSPNTLLRVFLSYVCRKPWRCSEIQQTCCSHPQNQGCLQEGRGPRGDQGSCRYPQHQECLQEGDKHSDKRLVVDTRKIKGVHRRNRSRNSWVADTPNSRALEGSGICPVLFYVGIVFAFLTMNRLHCSRYESLNSPYSLHIPRANEYTTGDSTI